MHRRRFLQLGAAAAATSLLDRARAADPAKGAAAQAQMEFAKFPQKTDLILHTDSPPNLETPLRYFREDLTPNDAFFVRWHLALIPTAVDVDTFRLVVHGHVDAPLSLSLDALRQDFGPVSLVAVNQCSGNSRSFFEPRVFGGQWGNGAMGNARWTGVRLKDILGKARLKAGAVDVTFQGLDRAPLPTVPNFIKSLSVDQANSPDALIAYEMNGQPLPMLNGFPLRLIVPGWYATYWVKSLNDITVLDKPFDGFWMAKAYRVPKNSEMNEDPKALAPETIPISAMKVRSIFVPTESTERAKAGDAVEFQGIALDGGNGIAKVEISFNAGQTWEAASLDPDLGKYSWRRWRYTFKPLAAGKFTVTCRATNNAGETQSTSQWNRSGYARNVLETMNLTVG